MRTLEELIKRARRETRNVHVGTLNAGKSIQDIEFVDAFRDAQELCQEFITNLYSNLFEDTVIIPVVARQAEYDLPEAVSYTHLTLPTKA